MVRGEIEGRVDDIRVDAMGNLIAYKKATQQPGSGLKLMLSAHMDEIGVIATHIDENGFVRFTTIGGVRPLTCIGGRVKFLNGAQGVIYMDRLDDPNKTPSIQDLYIDLGASSRSDSPVQVGNLAAFDRPFLDLGGRLVSKAMDNRISVAVLIETIKTCRTRRTNCTSCSAPGRSGPARRDHGCLRRRPRRRRGCRCNRHRRYAALGVYGSRAGKGPAIKVRDGGMLSDPRVVRWMVSAAEKEHMPYQLEVLEGAPPTRAPFNWHGRACLRAASRCRPATSIVPPKWSITTMCKIRSSCWSPC